MNSNAMSFKAKIRNYAKQSNIAAQVVLQNYMFECFLARLSNSDYKDKYVVKGGMLIAAIVGLDTRATMDLDTTLRDLPLTEEKVIESIESILNVKRNDDVSFVFQSIEPIRKDDVYGGYCVRIDALYDTIVTPLSIDVSTGDVMTPDAIEYRFSGIFDDTVSIQLWGYNIETIIAEKLETILRRGVFNTRPRDFYDAYILGRTQEYDQGVLKEALIATAAHRGSSKTISNHNEILNMISTDINLKNQWKKYQKQFEYASDIEYEKIIEVIKGLLS